MRVKFPGFTISPPPELTAHLNLPTGMTGPARTLGDYLDHYGTLDELVDPVFEQTIEGGYIDQGRAAALTAWLDEHPLVTALYPYRQLRQALAVASAEGAWTEEAEKGLLQFFAALPDAEALVKLPEELFGDMFAAIFDEQEGPVSLAGAPIEVTGPCLCGSHTAMYRIAEQAGGWRARNLQTCGYLFVARSHIEARVMSSKIASAVAGRMRYGAPQIVAEEYFPS